jgi:uncharacterized protein YkwD
MGRALLGVVRAAVVAPALVILAACVSGGGGGSLFGGADVTAVVQQRMPQASKLINAYRQNNGLGAVREDPRLMQAAAQHAQDLAATSSVSHYGSDGSDPASRARRAGYSFSNIGENVSAGRASLTEVIQAWIDSSPHRRNLELQPASHFGLAHSFSPESHYRHYWVLVLGEPAGAVGGARNGSDGGTSLSIGGFTLN